MRFLRCAAILFFVGAWTAGAANGMATANADDKKAAAANADATKAAAVADPAVANTAAATPTPRPRNSCDYDNRLSA